MSKSIVTDADGGKRFDTYVAEHLPQLSRASAQKLIVGELALVNKKPSKTGYKLRVGDEITINYQPKSIPLIELPVIYQDADCMVINKPSGVLTHSKGAFNPEATVATYVQKYMNNMEGDRAGIVHRLDRATSGVIICAKNPDALSWLQKQFSLRKVKKLYMAVVSGVPEPQSALIDMPIERNLKKPRTFKTSSGGKPATTEFRILKSSDKYSLIELKPFTGRTHQLRVHLNQIGHPIIGDVMYEGQPAERLMLHAYSLEITLPNRERHVFKVDTPPIFSNMMNQQK